ncbi:hypothetical protein GRJ2_000537800 [Grus japonensis]|uniref:Uncharacterized protein n=1 Tax=Grus japonensis TaxID=30415 RepID=A0ABC9W5S6_GRUJA
MRVEMQDAISQKSEAPSWVLTCAFDTNESDSSGKAWCFRIQNKVNFAVLKGGAVEENLFDSVCYPVTACQRGEKHHLSATKATLKVLVMLLQVCCKELHSSSK